MISVKCWVPPFVSPGFQSWFPPKKENKVFSNQMLPLLTQTREGMDFEPYRCQKVSEDCGFDYLGFSKKYFEKVKKIFPQTVADLENIFDPQKKTKSNEADPTRLFPHGGLFLWFSSQVTLVSKVTVKSRVK